MKEGRREGAMDGIRHISESTSDISELSKFVMV